MVKHAHKAKVDEHGKVHRKEGYLYFVNKAGKVMETKMKQHK